MRVLIVDDDRDIGQLITKIVSLKKIDVDLCATLDEARGKLNDNFYDLIICDLQMPRIDGMQFYRAMAAATPTLARRVIFVTGAVAGTDAERFLEESGCRWLAKPFRLGDLLRAARDALA